MRTEFRIQRLVITLLAICLGMLGVTPAAAEKGEAGTQADAESKQVSERLRHKDRAASSETETASVQSRETELNSSYRPAKSSSTPQHTPEWTHPDGSDPGQTAVAEKGGTADMNIGIGELSEQAAEETEGGKRKHKD